MTKSLIVNADGFGFTPGVNRGIRETIENGIVTSTSCVVNFGHLAGIRELKRDYPAVSIGVHFNLSVGRPVSAPSQVETLVDEDGQFLRSRFVRQLLLGRIRTEHLYKELSMQVKALLDCGVTPTHWDGHQNKHLFPPFFSVAMKVAKAYGVERMRCHRRSLQVRPHRRRLVAIAGYYANHPARIGTHIGGRVAMVWARSRGFRMADRLVTPGYADDGYKSDLATWMDIVATLGQGVNEIYCHPGYPDDELRANATYVEERAAEVRVLTSTRLKSEIERSRVRLISFQQL